MDARLRGKAICHTKIFSDIQPHDVEEAIAMAKRSFELGADGITCELDLYAAELRTEDNFRRMLAAVPGEWMFCLYRKDVVCGHDDAARMSVLLEAAKAGAHYIDVMCDLYDEQPSEISYDVRAIERQREVIARCHALGAKVIMSAHQSKRSVAADEVLRILRSQADRGVDIVKLVVGCETEDDFDESERTFARLNAELSIPWVFLGSGTFGHAQRFRGCEAGCAMTFARIQLMPDRVQPEIAEFVARRRAFVS